MTPLQLDRVLVPRTAPDQGPHVPVAGPVPPSRPTPAAAEDTSTRPRPTPRTGDARQPGTRPGPPSTGAVDLPDLTGAAEAEALTGVRAVGAQPGPRRGRDRRPLVAGVRRPVLTVAAALVGVVGLGGIALAAPSTGVARPVGESVGVAEELGLDVSTDAAVVEADAAARLRELAATRAAREDEQAAAAGVQAEADRLAAEAAAEAARPEAVVPVAGARITSGFGQRWGTLHGGLDLAAPMLTPEYAAMDGVVLEAGPASGYGQAIYLQHPNGDVTVYGHMEEILVQPGQVVRAGDTIALLGNQGQSSGPHLHFEVRLGGINGQKVDPVPYLRERGVAI